MKPIYKITVAVIILLLMSIAPKLVPEAQALRGRGAAFVAGAAVAQQPRPLRRPQPCAAQPLRGPALRRPQRPAAGE